MDELSFEPLIRQHVTLSNQPSSQGWWSCVCAVCNDYKKRGGFKFSEDTTSYHCFNCGHTAGHHHLSTNYSDNMLEVLDSFLIPDSEYNTLLLRTMQHTQTFGSRKNKPKVQVDPDTKLVEITTPDWMIPLSECDDSWSETARTYLQNDRCIDPKQYPFMIMDPKFSDREVEHKWKGRLIIPYYRSGKLIWYQGRDLRKHSRMRYLNANTASECILSDHSALFKRTNTPLFITEGFFDSVLIDGVAIFGNTFKVGQLKLLQQSHRRKVYVPDQSKDGRDAANQALAQGWEIAIPTIGSCKDINSAIKRFGKLYTLKSLYDNIYTGVEASVLINSIHLKR